MIDSAIRCVKHRQGQDLAADSLNAALQNGFASIDSLRDDPDLSGLRKTKEFRQVLEKKNLY